jgi:ubiquitin-large subunit ribosomal protein L40e
MLSFSVFIKPPTGKTMKLRILQQDTIELVKRKLEVQEGYPAAYQCMIFGGKRLDDACTVESYNIQDGYTIHLVMPLTVGRAHNSPHDATASK